MAFTVIFLSITLRSFVVRRRRRRLLLRRRRRRHRQRPETSLGSTSICLKPEVAFVATEHLFVINNQTWDQYYSRQVR